MNEMITTVFTSALVASVAGIAVSAWLESRKSKWMTKFDALKVSVELEGYAVSCADKLSAHKMAVTSDGHAGSFLGKIPEIPDLQIAIGFLRPKKAAVADRLLTFPQEYTQAKQSVDFWWEVAGADEYLDAAVNETATLGLMALALAKDLRAAFKLPSRDLIFGQYDIDDTLRKHVKRTA